MVYGFALSDATLSRGMSNWSVLIPWFLAPTSQSTGLSVFWLGKRIVQEDVDQRFVYLNAPVVFDKAECTEAVHEKAYARTGRSDHLRQGFLRDCWDQRFGFSRLVKLRQQQQDPRQTLFAGVKKLIDKIGLGSHASG